MNIVKLHATASTNDLMRTRFRESGLPHLTVISAHTQTNGRGQRGASWESEPGKNLTFSVLLTDKLQDLGAVTLNQLVSVALAKWLMERHRIQAKVKWPNDILSVHKKLAGILVETNFQQQQLNYAIVGIGLNVNQEEFEGLPNAASMKNFTGIHYDLDELLISFVSFLKSCLDNVESVLKEYYQYFYKLNQEAQFAAENRIFEATVKGVDAQGDLLLKEKGKLTAYPLKSVTWNYRL